MPEFNGYWIYLRERTPQELKEEILNAKIEYVAMMTDIEIQKRSVNFMSPKFEKVKEYFDIGAWNENQVRNAVVKNWITPEEFKLITGKDY